MSALPAHLFLLLTGFTGVTTSCVYVSTHILDYRAITIMMVQMCTRIQVYLTNVATGLLALLLRNREIPGVQTKLRKQRDERMKTYIYFFLCEMIIHVVPFSQQGLGNMMEN
jgi:hypothetical protein